MRTLTTRTLGGLEVSALGLGCMDLSMNYGQPADKHDGIALPVCAELGVGFVPWSPLGQGFLTGAVSAASTFESTDVRSRFPRFSPEARTANQPIVELLGQIAQWHGATQA